ncbi:MAG: Fur family transcriptional regulator, partial [Sphingomonadales bacterium]
MATEPQKYRQDNPKHKHSRCVSGAMRDAERVCQKRGVNLTPIRRQVLEMVWQGHHPVKAYEIIENFGGKSHSTKPPTVYRALDFLIENGLVHRIESQNAFVGCSHPVTAHNANFFICTCCQQAIEIDSER